MVVCLCDEQEGLREKAGNRDSVPPIICSGQLLLLTVPTVQVNITHQHSCLQRKGALCWIGLRCV